MTESLLDMLLAALPPFLALMIGVAALFLADHLLLRRKALSGAGERLPRQMAMLVLTGLLIVVLVLTLPVSESTRGQLLTLVGLLLTAMIALSSTTFVANAMAGLMLRSVRSFQPGDFVRIGEHFGRVTERGLFHTEIQTEDRDLTTLPNLFLISQPVSVVRSSGTIVSATVSLGYDVATATVEPLLLTAAKAAALEDPFVHVMEVGDHAITYRIAGFLQDVKRLLSVRSELRRRMIETLHGAGIEIVSPTFMNQRQLPLERKVVPARVTRSAPAEPVPARSVEEIAFDKAEHAEQQQRLRETSELLKDQIKQLEEGRKEADDAGRERIVQEIARRKGQIEAIEHMLARAEADNVD